MNETEITPAAYRTRLAHYIGEVCDKMGLDAEFREFYFMMCDRCLIDLEGMERAMRGEVEISTRQLADLKRDYMNDCITIANLPGVKLSIYDVMDLAREVSHIERHVEVSCVKDSPQLPGVYRYDPLEDDCNA